MPPFLQTTFMHVALTALAFAWSDKASAIFRFVNDFWHTLKVARKGSGGGLIGRKNSFKADAAGAWLVVPLSRRWVGMAVLVGFIGWGRVVV